MKLYARLLLTIPFSIVTFGYCKFHNPDENCHGLANIMIDGFFYIFATGNNILALIAIFFRRKELQKFKFELVTFSITILTIIAFIFNPFRGHTSGEKWVSAENKDSIQSASRQYLTLRKNGNFTVDLNEVDFSCSLSGSYIKTGDTIVLDHETIDRTDRNITPVYLIKSNELIPLFDTIKKIT